MAPCLTEPPPAPTAKKSCSAHDKPQHVAQTFSGSIATMMNNMNVAMLHDSALLGHLSRQIVVFKIEKVGFVEACDLIKCRPANPHTAA